MWIFPNSIDDLGTPNLPFDPLFIKNYPSIFDKDYIWCLQFEGDSSLLKDLNQKQYPLPILGLYKSEVDFKKDECHINQKGRFQYWKPEIQWGNAYSISIPYSTPDKTVELFDFIRGDEWWLSPRLTNKRFTFYTRNQDKALKLKLQS